MIRASQPRHCSGQLLGTATASQCGFMSVSMGPGWTQFTVMPLPARSRAQARVMPTNANFDIAWSPGRRAAWTHARHSGRLRRTRSAPREPSSVPAGPPRGVLRGGADRPPRGPRLRTHRPRDTHRQAGRLEPRGSTSWNRWPPDLRRTRWLRAKGPVLPENIHSLPRIVDTNQPLAWPLTGPNDTPLKVEGGLGTIRRQQRSCGPRRVPAGVGLAMPPNIVGQALLERGDLVNALPGWTGPELGLFVVVLERRWVSAAVRARVEHVREQLSDRL